MKRSFPPKISEIEYLTLTAYNCEDFTKAINSTTEWLARRGLLEAEYEHSLFSGAYLPTGRYRLSKRGGLMCRRYELSLRERDWHPNNNRQLGFAP